MFQTTNQPCIPSIDAESLGMTVVEHLQLGWLSAYDSIGLVGKSSPESHGVVPYKIRIGYLSYDLFLP